MLNHFHSGMCARLDSIWMMFRNVVSCSSGSTNNTITLSCYCSKQKQSVLHRVGILRQCSKGLPATRPLCFSDPQQHWTLGPRSPHCPCHTQLLVWEVGGKIDSNFFLKKSLFTRIKVQLQTSDKFSR